MKTERNYKSIVIPFVAIILALVIIVTTTQVIAYADQSPVGCIAYVTASGQNHFRNSQWWNSHNPQRTWPWRILLCASQYNWQRILCIRRIPSYRVWHAIPGPILPCCPNNSYSYQTSRFWGSWRKQQILWMGKSHFGCNLWEKTKHEKEIQS